MHRFGPGFRAICDQPNVKEVRKTLVDAADSAQRHNPRILRSHFASAQAAGIDSVAQEVAASRRQAPIGASVYPRWTVPIPRRSLESPARKRLALAG